MKAKFFINELPVLDADIESVQSWGVNFKIESSRNDLNVIAQTVMNLGGTMYTIGDVVAFNVPRESVTDIKFA